MPPAVDLSSTINSHEDRLQRVEDTTQGTSVAVAQLTVKMDNLTTVASEGFKDLKENDNKVMSQLEKHSQTLADHALRLSPLEEHRKNADAESKKRRDRVKGAIIALMLAGGGAFITKAVEVLWSRW